MRALAPLLVLALVAAAAPAATLSVPTGHAHNDYRHDRPLLAALEHGFASVEVDVHLVDGALLVGHDSADLAPDRTLQRLYLDPLRDHARRHGGRIYPDRELLLLVDLKTEAAPTYRRLRAVLDDYRDLLSTYSNDGAVPGAVAVVVSGERPRDLMLAETERLATYDGRLTDLRRDLPPHFMVLVSDDWQEHFAWRGIGPLPVEEYAELRHLACEAHAKGCLLRFWNLPVGDARRRARVWAELPAAGVDLISVDDLEAYCDFAGEGRHRHAP